jgi:hypothetical protein
MIRSVHQCRVSFGKIDIGKGTVTAGGSEGEDFVLRHCAPTRPRVLAVVGLHRVIVHSRLVLYASKETEHMKLRGKIMGLSAGFVLVSLLSGCIEEPIAVSSTGLVDWTGDAVAYSTVTGTGEFIALCSAELVGCSALLPGDAPYTFFPEEGSGLVQFYPGIPVVPQGGGAPVGLPIGMYRMEVVQRVPYEETVQIFVIEELPLLPVGIDPEGPDPLPVQQSVGLPDSGSCADVDESLLEWGAEFKGGWTRSWQEWVNGGQGGDTCTRMITYVRSTGQWEPRSSSSPELR